MHNQELLTNIISILTGTEFVIGIIIFILLSYLLISLLTRSFHKPLKYFSISFIIVGIMMIIFRFILPLIITSLAENPINIPNSISSTLLNPFLKSGIICIIIGIIFMVVYKLIEKLQNNKDISKIDEKANSQEVKTKDELNS